MHNFKDKVVVITGAGSGIGRALAMTYAGYGAVLHLVDIDRERIASTGRDAAASGVRITTHVLDCSVARNMESLAKEVLEKEGRVDVLHNNAGILVAGPVHEISPDGWNRIVDVNLWSAVHGIRAFVPIMMEQGGGIIVNTASIAGLYAFPFVSPYSMTKAALVGLSEALDIELSAHGIRVLAVCPSAVKTNVLRDGRMSLPGKWGQRFIELMEKYAPGPEKTAMDIVSAVQKEQPLWIGISGKPLWWLKRLTPGLYSLVFKLLVKKAISGND
ncbi:MAG: SDR family oxidoreductase [Deltaproteobacteria bacterium]|nr:SDR family oxidoreductase [Deltaproteobacteria bacterium]